MTITRRVHTITTIRQYLHVNKPTNWPIRPWCMNNCLDQSLIGYRAPDSWSSSMKKWHENKLDSPSNTSSLAEGVLRNNLHHCEITNPPQPALLHEEAR